MRMIGDVCKLYGSLGFCGVLSCRGVVSYPPALGDHEGAPLQSFVNPASSQRANYILQKIKFTQNKTWFILREMIFTLYGRAQGRNNCKDDFSHFEPCLFTIPAVLGDPLSRPKTVKMVSLEMNHVQNNDSI